MRNVYTHCSQCLTCTCACAAAMIWEMSMGAGVGFLGGALGAQLAAIIMAWFICIMWWFISAEAGGSSVGIVSVIA